MHRGELEVYSAVEQYRRVVEDYSAVDEHSSVYSAVEQ